MVQPQDLATGTTPVTVTFDEVTESGATTLTISNTGPPPPSGFQLGEPPTFYEVTTTASHSGQIELCIDYSGIGFTGDESQLRLTHYDEVSEPLDVTVLPVDTVNKIICGIVDSLSPFAVVEPINHPPPSGGGGPASGGGG